MDVRIGLWRRLSAKELMLLHCSVGEDSWESIITADGDCSHEIKRHLLLGRKAMTNLDSILQIRDITLLTKVRLVKAMIFPVVMYGCKSWTIKKAECWKIGAFELWSWRKLLRFPWTAMRSNQSILKEISPEYSLEGSLLKLKLQYFSHLMQTTPWMLRTPDAGKDWRQEEKGMTEDEMVGWHYQLNRDEFKQAPGVGDGQGGLVCYSPWGRKKSDTTEQLNWTEYYVSSSLIFSKMVASASSSWKAVNMKESNNPETAKL